MPSILLWFLAACLCFSPLARAAAEVEPARPAALIDRLHTELLTLMKDGPRLGYEGRLQRIRPIIAAADDWQTVCRSILGKHWNELSEEQRQKFIRTFQELSAAMYAANFDSWSGEQFKTIEEKALPRGSVLVRAQLTSPGQDAVHFDYLLRKAGEEWKIVNIVVDGVSDVALKRAEYSRIMDSEGIDGLLKRMQEKIAAQEHEKYQAPPK